MAVITDIIEGNIARLGFNGWEFTRVFKVTGLTGPGYQRLIEASLTSGVPSINEPHPYVQDAYVIDIVPESVDKSNTDARVTVTYRQFTANVQVSVSGRSVTSELNSYYTDQANGDIDFMKLGYTYPADNAYAPNRTDTQGVVLQVSEAFPSFTYSRTEWTTIAADALSGWPVGVQLTGNILVDRLKKYDTALNRGTFQGDPAKKWSVRINAVSSPTGFDWRVSYTFSYDPKEWAYRAVYKDPYTGEPVPNPSLVLPADNPSAKDFPVYRTQDFNLLGIS